MSNRVRALLPSLSLPREMARASVSLTVAYVVLIGLGAALPTASMLLTGTVVDAVRAAAGRGLGSPSARVALAWLGVLAGVTVAQRVRDAVSGVVSGVLARRTVAQIAERIMTALLAPQSVAHLEDPALHDDVMRANAGSLASSIAAFGTVWSRRLAGCAALVLVARFRWWLALPLAIALAYGDGKVRTSFQQLVSGGYNQSAVLRRAMYLQDLASTPGGAKEVRVFGLAPLLIARFRATWLRAMQPIWDERRRLLPRMLRGTVPVLAVQGLCIGLAARDALHGGLAIGAFIVVVQAAMRSDEVITHGHDRESLEHAAVALGPIYRIETASAGARLVGKLPAPSGEIRFEDVCFRYPGADRDVFEHLDLVIEPGTSLAIVGLNGAGKTTLVKLLARLYDPSSGRVTVGAIDLRDVDASSWQRCVAAITQDFIRYPLSALENVTVGCLEHADDRDRVLEAAQRAGASSVVEGLPNRWDTVLSRSYTDGSDLSGGQWQRIALARALFADAPVLVLDEPTAQLDARSEADFYDRFLDITRGRTSIVISHRFSSVRRADAIVVLEGGRVIERGTHDELVAADGRYASLFALQSARYEETA